MSKLEKVSKRVFRSLENGLSYVSTQEAETFELKGCISDEEIEKRFKVYEQQFDNLYNALQEVKANKLSYKQLRSLEINIKNMY